MNAMLCFNKNKYGEIYKINSSTRDIIILDKAGYNTFIIDDYIEAFSSLDGKIYLKGRLIPENYNKLNGDSQLGCFVYILDDEENIIHAPLRFKG